VLYTRRHPRFRLSAAELNGQMTFASEVSILDIGLGGVSVRADKRLNIGGTYLLKLDGPRQSLSLRCEVAWARFSGTRRSDDGESTAIYTAGMKFVDLAPEHAGALQLLIDTLAPDAVPDDGDRRSYPRFPPKPPGLALLDFPADYTVRTISLGGMLIQCPSPIDPESRIPMQLVLQGGQVIEFQGRVVSCQPAPSGDVASYYAGIEFIGLAEDGRTALAAFIAGLGSADG
jgi:hypothetical protein